MPNTACPNMMTSTRMKIGRAYSTSIWGSTSIPTDTKNTAPNRFFTGSTSFIILSASMVSARIDPMTNAPNALLKPTCVDRTAMAQHSPRAMINSVSLLMSLRTERNIHGMRNMPTTNQRMRKKAIFATLPSIWPPSGLLPLAMAESITIITMASTSSSISTLITNPAKRCCLRPRSSKAL